MITARGFLNPLTVITIFLINSVDVMNPNEGEALREDTKIDCVADYK